MSRYSVVSSLEHTRKVPNILTSGPNRHINLFKITALIQFLGKGDT